jgi:hypothetical protein
MRVILLSLTVSTVAVIALNACNGGGNNLAAGTQCDAGYDPISDKPNSIQKPVPQDSASNKSTQQMKPGVYTYSRADLYYVEKTKPDQAPVQIQVVDAVTSDVSVKQSVICMRNARPKMNGFVADTYGVTDIEICPDYSQVITTRHFKFDITNGAINFTVPTGKDPNGQDEIQSKVGDVLTTYGALPSDKVNSVTFVQNTNTTNDYEVRSFVDRPDAKYALAIHMVFQACDPIKGCQVTKCNKPPAATENK